MVACSGEKMQHSYSASTESIRTAGITRGCGSMPQRRSIGSGNTLYVSRTSLLSCALYLCGMASSFSGRYRFPAISTSNPQPSTAYSPVQTRVASTVSTVVEVSSSFSQPEQRKSILVSRSSSVCFILVSFIEEPGLAARVARGTRNFSKVRCGTSKAQFSAAGGLYFTAALTGGGEMHLFNSVAFDYLLLRLATDKYNCD
jgi:hypothetical protein